MADFSLGGMIAPPAQDQAAQFREGATAAMKPIIEMMTRRVKASQEAEFQSQTQVETDAEGFAHVKVPIPYLNEMVSAAGKFRQIEGVYEQQRMQKEAEIAKARAHPWANTLATIAGSLAANDPNPITRGLGEAAIRLNPQPAQLEAERNQALRGEQEAVGNEVKTYGDLASYYQSWSREQREERKQAQTDAEKALSDKREAVKEGVRMVGTNAFDRSGWLQLAEMSGIPKPEREAMATSFEAGAKNRADRDAAKETAKDDRQRALIDASFTRQQKQIDAEFAMIRERADLKEKGDAKKLVEHDAKEIEKARPKLVSLSAADNALDRIDAIIKKYGGVMGVMAGRTVGGRPGAYFDADLAKARTDMDREVAQAIQAMGAGARGFGPQERDYFQKIAPRFTKSAEENLGSINSMRNFIRQNRGAYRDVYQALDDPKYASLFGHDSDILQAPEADISDATARGKGSAFASTNVPKDLQEVTISSPDGNYLNRTIGGKKYKSITVKGGKIVAAEN
jgi:hypothetical protein